jgi:hypothetical protein
MVGSLVATLPSEFTGGALEVEHNGSVTTYRGSKKAISLVAFYSDCRHQVRPVRSGYRIVLTYNLSLRGEPATDPGSSEDPALVDELAHHLDGHFSQSESPSRLVYLLDHEYTARGLSWSSLKGDDALSASTLRLAAGRAGCEVALALADVHEMWSAYELNLRYPRHGWRQEWSGGDDDEVEDEEGYELDELIESGVILGNWLTSADGKVEPVELSIGEDELCASTPNEDLRPYSSECEGYMGNWGNTLDRWYHRGAVVVWPSSLDFPVRAEASPTWAVDALTSTIRTGDLDAARGEAALLAPFWGRVVSRVGAKGFLTKVMSAARLLDEPVTAAMLVAPFSLEMIGPGHAAALSNLVESYGERWAAEVVGGWSADRQRFHSASSSTMAWIVLLPRLIRALAARGEAGRTAALLLLRDAWRRLGDAVDQALDLESPSERAEDLAELGAPIAAVLQGASVIGATDLTGEMTTSLCQEAGELVSCAIEVLRAVPRTEWGAAGLDPVARDCGTVLQARLVRTPRRADDWSIPMPRGCGCELCETLSGFLTDPALTIFEWPIAQVRRSHIHRRVDAADLPVLHRTRRQGSPYVLVLTKTEKHFELEAHARRRDKSDLSWIEGDGRSRSRRR